MRNLKITPIKPEHAAITPYLRKADLEEINAMTGLNPELAVAYSIAHTEKGFSAIYNKKIVSIFGVSNGLIWLVGTDEISEHPITFFKLSKKIFPELTTGYKRLENYVDERNKLSLRWLKWLGFNIEPPVRVAGGFFHNVWWEAK